jgi:hypothetical protein
MAASGENLGSLLSKSECYCLNEDVRAPHTNLFVGDHTLPLRSDADEQLLLHLALNQTVKLSSIEIGIPNDDSCPQHIKLFSNLNNLGFDDASGTAVAPKPQLYQPFTERYTCVCLLPFMMLYD